MKLLIILAFVVVVTAQPLEDDHYDSRFDNFDVESFASNMRIIKSFYNCYLGKAHCSADAEYVKDKLSEGIKSECSKCTDKQKVILAKLMRIGMEKVPDDFDAVVKMYTEDHDVAANRLRVENFIAKYS